MKRLLIALVAVLAAPWVARADGETNETATAMTNRTRAAFFPLRKRRRGK